MGTSEVGIINTTICVLDIETTGFEPGPAEIVELFILKVEENNIIDEFYSLFKPKSSITNSHTNFFNEYFCQGSFVTIFSKRNNLNQLIVN